VTIARSKRRVGGARLRSVAESLLEASTLCAIATVSRGSHAHVNTAYFAWADDLRLIWLSDPGAAHSRNLRARASAAVAVYDSAQTWGNPDRGIQVFGSPREAEDGAEQVYAARFRDFARSRQPSYRFYELLPHRVKLFDEEALGAGAFVTARVLRGGALAWERTDLYR
jgi:uncharacterized protein YhbP (UPF0306 family)